MKRLWVAFAAFGAALAYAFLVTSPGWTARAGVRALGLTGLESITVHLVVYAALLTLGAYLVVRLSAKTR